MKLAEMGNFKINRRAARLPGATIVVDNTTGSLGKSLIGNIKLYEGRDLRDEVGKTLREDPFADEFTSESGFTTSPREAYREFASSEPLTNAEQRNIPDNWIHNSEQELQQMLRHHKLSRRERKAYGFPRRRLFHFGRP